MSKRGAAIISIVLAMAAMPASAVAKDSDHDGLPNSWEKGKTPNGLNLRKLGASPKHRDVFVQLDYAKGATSPNDISCAGLNSLVKAYAAGPLTNPDGRKGIRLHIDAGKKCPGHDYDLGGSRTFKVAGPCASFGDVGNGLPGKRLPVFHLGAVVSDAQLCGAEGEADSTDFIVKARGGGNDFAYVVMHELGHVFGLVHGITNDADVPIDKFSVMAGSLKDNSTPTAARPARRARSSTTSAIRCRRSTSTRSARATATAPATRRPTGGCTSSSRSSTASRAASSSSSTRAAPRGRSISIAAGRHRSGFRPTASG
jgi:hypothetical protein